MSAELNQIDFESAQRILFLGVGNIGRQDDGLGIYLIERLQAAQIPSRFTCEANYQLNIEDALLISTYDLVIFVDASKEPNAKAPFGIRKLEPAHEMTFSTHAMSFKSILALCEELYQKNPKTYVLSLPGYEWEIGDTLSPKAEQNLQAAYDALLAKI